MLIFAVALIMILSLAGCHKLEVSQDTASAPGSGSENVYIGIRGTGDIEVSN